MLFSRVLLFVLVVTGLKGESIGAANGLRAELPVLTQLLHFIQWPEATAGGERLIVGLAGYGEQPPAEWYRKAASRPVEFRAVQSAAQMRACHVVLFGLLFSGRLESLLQALSGHPVLTIAAIPGFARMGGMVELPALSEGHKLTVNLIATRRSGFRIHPGLVSVAEFLRRE
ncbi:MAG: YfiR family protein [Bryobacteraceae bacterium]